MKATTVLKHGDRRHVDVEQVHASELAAMLMGHARIASCLSMRLAQQEMNIAVILEKDSRYLEAALPTIERLEHLRGGLVQEIQRTADLINGTPTINVRSRQMNVLVQDSGSQLRSNRREKIEAAR